MALKKNEDNRQWLSIYLDVVNVKTTTKSKPV